MISAAHRAVIPSNAYARRIRRIHQVVPRDHKAGYVALVLAGHLDADVYVMDQVSLDDNLRATVHVNTIGIVLVTLTRIVYSRNVVDGIAGDRTVAGVVVRWVGRNALEANNVDSYVVVIMNDVIGDRKVADVPVHIHRFALAGLKAINLVAANRDTIEGGGRCRAVHGNAESVAVGF